jgi:outer membrane protein TolC
LVRQRPDIRAAEANLHRASAEIGVATADLFPTLSLSGSLGNNTAAWTDVGRSAGTFWSGSGAIEIPIFQGGRSIYSRRAAIHAYQAAQASYRQVVLSAFQQVADVLRAVEHDSQGVSTQRLIVELAQSTYAIAQANASAGLIDGLALMSADIALKQAEYALDAALAVRLQDAVALYVALGGGW